MEGDGGERGEDGGGSRWLPSTESGARMAGLTRSQRGRGWLGQPRSIPEIAPFIDGDLGTTGARMSEAEHGTHVHAYIESL